MSRREEIERALAQAQANVITEAERVGRALVNAPFGYPDSQWVAQASRRLSAARRARDEIQRALNRMPSRTELGNRAAAILCAAGTRP